MAPVALDDDVLTSLHADSRVAVVLERAHHALGANAVHGVDVHTSNRERVIVEGKLGQHVHDRHRSVIPTEVMVQPQLIDDFAVVFSLNPKQVLVLRDTLLQPKEDA